MELVSDCKRSISLALLRTYQFCRTITKKLVETMGGQIDFISAPGICTEFTILVPATVLREDEQLPEEGKLQTQRERDVQIGISARLPTDAKFAWVNYSRLRASHEDVISSAYYYHKTFETAGYIHMENDSLTAKLHKTDTGEVTRNRSSSLLLSLVPQPLIANASSTKLLNRADAPQIELMLDTYLKSTDPSPGQEPVLVVHILLYLHPSWAAADYKWFGGKACNTLDKPAQYVSSGVRIMLEPAMRIPLPGVTDRHVSEALLRIIKRDRVVRTKIESDPIALSVDTKDLNEPSKIMPESPYMNDTSLSPDSQNLLNEIQELPFSILTPVDSLTFEKMKILVVDDNALNRKVALRSLEKLGIKDVTMACDGREAAEVCCATLPQEGSVDHIGWFHIILMDLQMPVMGGNEVSPKLYLTKSVLRSIILVN